MAIKWLCVLRCMIAVSGRNGWRWYRKRCRWCSGLWHQRPPSTNWKIQVDITTLLLMYLLCWPGRRSYVFFGSGPTHFFRSWVRIGIGSTHFLRWIVYYCICIQHDIDKSQISFIELCKTLRTNSGLRAINSCLHLFWPQLCKPCWVNIVLWQQNL